MCLEFARWYKFILTKYQILSENRHKIKYTGSISLQASLYTGVMLSVRTCYQAVLFLSIRQWFSTFLGGDTHSENEKLAIHQELACKTGGPQ